MCQFPKEDTSRWMEGGGVVEKGRKGCLLIGRHIDWYRYVDDFPTLIITETLWIFCCDCDSISQDSKY